MYITAYAYREPRNSFYSPENEGDPTMFVFELDILFQMTRPALTLEGGTLRSIIFLLIEGSSSVRTTLSRKKAKLLNLFLNIE